MLSNSRQSPGALGATLRDLRTRYGLTQVALGERTGTDRSYIARVETRPADEIKPRVSREMVKKWGRALGRTDQERRESTNALLASAGYAVESPTDQERRSGASEDPLLKEIRDELRAVRAAVGKDAPSAPSDDLPTLQPPDLGPVLVGFTRAHHMLPAEKYRQLVALITNQVPMVTDLLARGELGPTRYRSDQSDEEEVG